MRTCTIEPAALSNAERWLAQRRSSWETSLDRLGEYLAEEKDKERAKEQQVSDRSSKHATFVIERTYDASPGRVFAAWAERGSEVQMVRTQVRGRVLELDFAVGGREHSRWERPTAPATPTTPPTGTSSPTRRIVYTYEMHRNDDRISVSVATIELEPAGEGTRLQLTEQGVFLDGHDTPAEREHGTGELMDALGAALATTAHSA